MTSFMGRLWAAFGDGAVWGLVRAARLAGLYLGVELMVWAFGTPEREGRIDFDKPIGALTVGEAAGFLVLLTIIGIAVFMALREDAA